jgi:Uma2 family endonuclease
MVADTLTPPHRSVKKRQSAGPLIPRMTEAEFVDWCDSETWAEWKDGEVILMSPLSDEHNTITMFLSGILLQFIDEQELGRLYSEPYQIRLPDQKRRRSPDLFFVSTERLNLVERYQVNGPPDLIIEVLSPESQSRDRREKFLEYEAAAVREYWLVDPMSETVEIYVLGKSKKYELVEEIDGAMPSKVLKGFFLKETWLWQTPRPKISTILRQIAKAK